MKYHNEIRTHLSLEKYAPVSRAVWPGPFFAARFWAGCTTNMFGFDLRQAQARNSVMYGTTTNDGA
jgi:hypothetical protein